MAFMDKMKKGLGDVTRVGSDELDSKRRVQQQKEVGGSIDQVKIKMGEMIYISYKRGDPVDDAFIEYCERIDRLIAEGNRASYGTQNNSGDSDGFSEWDDRNR